MGCTSSAPPLGPEVEVVVGSKSHPWFKVRFEPQQTCTFKGIGGAADGSLLIWQGTDILRYMPGSSDPEVLVSSKTHKWFDSKARLVGVAGAADGSLFIFQGNTVGESRIYKYSPGSEEPQLLAASRSHSWFHGEPFGTDIAGAADGSLLVFEGAAFGEAKVLKLAPGSAEPEVVLSSKTHKWFTGCPTVTSLAAAPDGAIYVYQGANIAAQVKVFKCLPGGEEPEVVLSSRTHKWFCGVTEYTGIACAADSSLFVFQGAPFGECKIYKFKP